MYREMNGFLEYQCELSLDLDILKSEVPYKYFVCKSKEEDGFYEFLHSAPGSRRRHVNRCLIVPKEKLGMNGNVFA